MKKIIQKEKIKEIGIAVPGTIKGTAIIKSVNLGVKNYNLVENLQKEINLPIKIRNDAKCAAIAENKMGALKDYKRSIFLSLGTGIGGAVIINNELLDTGDLSGCEFGYYADAKGNADGNAKQTAGTESIHRCPYWAAK